MHYEVAEGANKFLFFLCAQWRIEGWFGGFNTPPEIPKFSQS
jgi:hypothetical protein